jgi:hypothetical protein
MPLLANIKQFKHLSLTNIMRLSQSSSMQVEWQNDWRGMQGDLVEGEIMGSGQSVEFLFVV